MRIKGQQIELTEDRKHKYPDNDESIKAIDIIRLYIAPSIPTLEKMIRAYPLDPQIELLISDLENELASVRELLKCPKLVSKYEP